MSESLWGIARQKVESLVADPRYNYSGKTIKDSFTVLKILRNYNYLPVNIISTEEGIQFNFYSSTMEYQIIVDEDSSLFCHDKKRCLYRRDENDQVELTYEVEEYKDLNELSAAVSKIPIDTIEKKIKFVEAIGFFPPNWHINYKISSSFQGSQINNSIKLIEYLEKKHIRTLCVYPVVLSMKGDVAIRYTIQCGVVNYLADILINDVVEFNYGVYLAERDCSKKMSVDEFIMFLGESAVNLRNYVVIPVTTTPEEDAIDREVEAYFASKSKPKSRVIYRNPHNEGQGDGSK